MFKGLRYTLEREDIVRYLKLTPRAEVALVRGSAGVF